MLTGSNLMFVLLGFYGILLVVFLMERNWAKALYWFGAILLNFSVVMMK